jgi:hypothetical protein
MAIASAKGHYTQVTVGTTATVVLPPNSLRQGYVIFNNTSTVAYLGADATVTSSNGMPALQNVYVGVAGDAGEVTAIVASGTTDLRVMELY